VLLDRNMTLLFAVSVPVLFGGLWYNNCFHTLTYNNLHDTIISSSVLNSLPLRPTASTPVRAFAILPSLRLGLAITGIISP
jgi:hypothetical protein